MDYNYNLGLSFYVTAELQQNHTALQYPDGEKFSYAFINKLSNQFAMYLLATGIKKGNVVAIFNNKSVHTFSLMIGCLKIGAIYTNLDFTSPPARLKKIISTCKPSILFFDPEYQTIIEALDAENTGLQCTGLQDDKLIRSVHEQSDQNLKETFLVDGNNPAYIMFTSGSTGFPKGAVMSHNNVLNFIYWTKQNFKITSQDILTNANPVYFDNSVFDFYASLFNGAMLVPLSNELVKNPRQLVQAINNAACTFLFSVPSLLVYLLTTRALSKEDFKTVRAIVFGGEGFPKNKLSQLYELFGNRMQLYNVYGPTECTCICSSYIINKADFKNMHELAPLGFIAPNFSYQILPLDANENYGELALMGPCVGLGYFNDEERTAKSFVQHKQSCYSRLMYKTGDLVEKADNGYLYFRGRVDNQVKHMGYRIELEEVEAAFSSLPYINEVGVVYQKMSADLGYIKAFISMAVEDKDEMMILDDIKNLLPPYMVPKKLQVMPVLPKNSNGKIDRKQLSGLT